MIGDDLFEYRRKRNARNTNDALDFQHTSRVEHVDSSTIVERIEMTDEIKLAFKRAGYTTKE